MSNLLPSTVADECGPEPRGASSIEALQERAARLGSLEIHRLLPARGRRLIGPWCFLDRFGPLEFKEEKVMDVGPHPHLGLQTVTWLFEGEIVHNDSLGSECLIRPGQLSLMTAGRGIAHTEETPARNSGSLDGVQLWLALPAADRDIAPAYQCTSGQPVVAHRGGLVTVILGDFAGAHADGKMFSPGMASEIAVHANQALSVPLNPAFEYGVLLGAGDAQVLGVAAKPNTLYYLGVGCRELPVLSHSGARLLLIGGAPFGETVLMWWNFVARSQDELESARRAWEEREVFGDVPGYSGPRIPAPALLGRAIPSQVRRTK